MSAGEALGTDGIVRPFLSVEGSSTWLSIIIKKKKINISFYFVKHEVVGLENVNVLKGFCLTERLRFLSIFSSWQLRTAYITIICQL